MQLNLIIVVPVYFGLAICRKSIFILILRANQSLHVNLCHSQLVYRWRCQLLVRALTTMESNNHEAVSTVCVGMRAYKNIYVYSHAWRKYFWIRYQELLLDFQYGGLHVLFKHGHCACACVWACVCMCAASLPYLLQPGHSANIHSKEPLVVIQGVTQPRKMSP